MTNKRHQATTGYEQEAMLIVDDDEVWRSRLMRAMSTRGYEVVGACDYDQAVTAASERDFELAVVDLRMPGKGGLEVVGKLHKLQPELRILVLTGYGSITTAVDAVKLGAVSYLQKPADADDILHAFERAEYSPLEQPPELSYETTPSLARAEWEHINRVLADCNQNITLAARVLGIHRRSLQRKLQKYPPKE